MSRFTRTIGASLASVALIGGVLASAPSAEAAGRTLDGRTVDGRTVLDGRTVDGRTVLDGRTSFTLPGPVGAAQVAPAASFVPPTLVATRWSSEGRNSTKSKAAFHTRKGASGKPHVVRIGRYIPKGDTLIQTPKGYKAITWKYPRGIYCVDWKKNSKLPYSYRIWEVKPDRNGCTAG